MESSFLNDQDDDKRPYADLLRYYQTIVVGLHPNSIHSWPLLNGWNILSASYKGWSIAVIQDAGFTSMTSQSGLGEISSLVVGFENITESNRSSVRRNLESHFSLSNKDIVFLFPPNNNYGPEFEAMLTRHERAMGLMPIKIFLSHKGYDKPKVRQFRDILKTLGFDPWLDEDAMPAGTSLERGILKGFEDSCAAFFFVTPQFQDQDYLATEVDYAIRQKRKKTERFSIITLVFGDGVARGSVPELLHGYVWKEPISDVEALREILVALPIGVGQVNWR